MRRHSKNSRKINENAVKKRLKYDTHRIPRNTCKTISGWAERLNLHPTTIRGWLKSGEARAIDSRLPILIHALDMKSCLESKNEHRKKPIMSNEIFCFSCQEGRKPILESVHIEINAQNRPVIRGICSVCDGKLFRITNESQAQQKITELKMPQHRLQQLSTCTTPSELSHFDEKDFINTYNPANERLKYKYFEYLREAKGYSKKSLTTISTSILRCERMLDFTNIEEFDRDVAKQLKRKLKNKQLSRDSVISTLSHYQGFLHWLKEQTGYKRKYNYTDLEYLTVQRQEKASLGYKRLQRYPSIDDIIETVLAMPTDTPKQRRDQAMMALLALTGLRDGTTPQLRLKHLRVEERFLEVEPREVSVKCGNYHIASFMPVDERLIEVLAQYTKMLKSQYRFHADDPLFPKLSRKWEHHAFVEGDFSKDFMADAQILQRVCNQAFENHISERFSPHKIRHTLAELSKKIAKNPMELKALSQNLGHITTRHIMETYSQLDPHRHIEVMDGIYTRNIGELRQ